MRTAYPHLWLLPFIALASCASPGGTAGPPPVLPHEAWASAARLNYMMPGQSGTGLGSGFFVSDDGLLVTCYHLNVRSPFPQVVYLPNGQQAVAQIVAVDPQHDLSVMRVDVGPPGLFRPLPLSRRAPRPGDPVWVVGAFGVSEGQVVGPGRGPEGVGEGFRLTTTAARQGASGSAVMDASGRVVGILSRVTAAKDRTEAHAVPAARAADLLGGVR